MARLVIGNLWTQPREAEAAVGFVGAYEVPIAPEHAGLATEAEEGVGYLPGRPAGKMRVQFGIHGGTKAFLDVIEGLVERNARAIREGYPRLKANHRVGYKDDHVWRDVPNMLAEGAASAGSFAAWRAAEARVDGDQSVRIAMVGGIPMVVRVERGQVVTGSIEDPTPGRMIQRGYAKPRPDTVAAVSDEEGVNRDWMYVTIDDNIAAPVREINTAIARHNARRIQAKGLPPLYESGVVYKVEGSPELWWDYEEQLATGHDDCEGLAATRAGELMLQGYDAKVWTREIPKPTQFAGGKPGGRLFHAITRVDGKWDESGEYRPLKAPDGTPIYDDPSVRLGMPVPPWYLAHARQRRSKGLDL